jgi:hypothetical protein
MASPDVDFRQDNENRPWLAARLPERMTEGRKGQRK